MFTPFRMIQALRKFDRLTLSRVFDMCTFMSIYTRISGWYSLLIKLYNSRFMMASKGTQESHFLYLSYDKPCGELALGQNWVEIYQQRVTFCWYVSVNPDKYRWHTTLCFHVQFDHSVGMSRYCCNCTCSLARWFEHSGNGLDTKRGWRGTTSENVSLGTLKNEETDP